MREKPQRRTIIRRRNVQKCSEDYSFLTCSLPNVFFATAACNYSTSERPKVLRRLQFFHMFTSKCAFRHSGVQLFDIGTSKSAPKTTVFSHVHFQMRFSPQRRTIFRRVKSKKCFGPDVFCAFSLQMCFSPQRRTIIRHLNFKKCSETVSFLAFSLQNLLFATAACNF